jgi:hypothetical protein
MGPVSPAVGPVLSSVSTFLPDGTSTVKAATAAGVQITYAWIRPAVGLSAVVLLAVPKFV